MTITQYQNDDNKFMYCLQFDERFGGVFHHISNISESQKLFKIICNII